MKVICWAKSACNEASVKTKHRFEKRGFLTTILCDYLWDYLYDYLTIESDNDNLFFELSLACSFDAYIDFDNQVPTSEEVDVSLIDWRQALREELFDAVVNADTESKNSDSEGDVCDRTRTPPITISAKEAMNLLDQVRDFA